MDRSDNSDSIPIDLILEILTRLPSKSVGRFHCVSKLWRSMLSSPYFKEMYLTKSSARPRLLFSGEGVCEEELRFYSSPQPQIPYDKSALVVASDYHTTFPLKRCVYASGLICFHGKGCSGEDAMTPMICNPITGEYANLPDVTMNPKSDTFLGFDSVEKQFKVLVATYQFHSPTHKILTLGVPTLRWRSMIDCPSYYYYCSLSEGICINGVLYYLAYDKSDKKVIVCFDVRFEEFKIINVEDFYDGSSTRLINYKGKLGVISWKSKDAIELHMWVLHDVETQEWSKYVYTLPENEVISLRKYSIAGMTTRGEIVLSPFYTFKPFHVFYFNPQKNTLRSVEIKGFGDDLRRVKVFVDYVEDFNLTF